MNSGKTVFSQLMDFSPAYSFRLVWIATTATTKCKAFNAGIVSIDGLCFSSPIAKVSGTSETSLETAGDKLYHMGIRGKVSRDTLAHANEVRDWRIYQDFAQVLI